MKTKHLFFATALVASFASCTNDDIVEVQQGLVNVERPTVEDVQLNFVADGVDSRLTFGSNGYAWEATDTIGALNMDTPLFPAGDEPAWEDMYRLENYVNTSYPFTYSTEDGTWSCAGKMLEGNYFFAFPWSSYDGGRTVKHSLFNQKQTGVAGSAVAQSYADNQFFIGYSQIKKGAGFDVLEDVEMTDVLGAIQLRMVNNYEKPLHVYKVVLEGPAIAGSVTFAPADAAYEYDGDEDMFNVSKYIGDVKYVGEKNNRADALRNVVKKDLTNNVAQLVIEGTEAERTIAKGATGYALIMTAPINETEYGTITQETVTVSVFTDEGVFADAFDLYDASNINGDKVKEIKPGVATTVQVNLQTMTDINAIEAYNESDLLKLINWNIKANTATPIYATLMTDITLTKEVFDLLKSNNQLTLNIAGTKKLTLAEDLPSNVLDYAKLKVQSTGGVEVLGAINFTKSTTVGSNTLTIAKGASLAINVNTGGTDEAVLPTIVNKGTITIGAVKIADAQNITNNLGGVITIAANADVQTATDKLVNKGTINLNGYMNGVTNGTASRANDEAVINLGEGATLETVDNYAAINAAKTSTVNGSNKEADAIVTIADTTVDVAVGTAGMVAVKHQGDVAKDAYKNTGINTLILTSGETKFKDATTGGITNVIALDGAKLVAANGVALSLTSLEINGAVEIATTTAGEATVLSSVKATKATIKKGATLTNNGDLTVTTTWMNEGQVINNEAVALCASGYATPGNWKYKKPSLYTAPTVDPELSFQLCFYTPDGSADGWVFGKNLEDLSSVYTANDDVTVLKIASDLDMNAAATTANKKNKDYASVLEKAEEIIFGAGASYTISNLKEAYAVTANKFTVNSNVTISGSTNMVLLTVDELVVESGKKLTITGGYLAINVTAVAGKGCEAIEAAATQLDGTGAIVAYNAAGELLFWNKLTSKWQKEDVRLNVTVTP